MVERLPLRPFIWACIKRNSYAFNTRILKAVIQIAAIGFYWSFGLFRPIAGVGIKDDNREKV